MIFGLEIKATGVSLRVSVVLDSPSIFAFPAEPRSSLSGRGKGDEHCCSSVLAARSPALAAWTSVLAAWTKQSVTDSLANAADAVVRLVLTDAEADAAAEVDAEADAEVDAEVGAEADASVGRCVRAAVPTTSADWLWATEALCGVEVN